MIVATGAMLEPAMLISTRANSVGGTSMPSVLAVLRLMTSSNLIGVCTGRSAWLGSPQNAIDLVSRRMMTPTVRKQSGPLPPEQVGQLKRRFTTATRAHGRDERVLAQSFCDTVDFMYALVTGLGQA
jgi:hypothetical protein